MSREVVVRRRTYRCEVCRDVIGKRVDGTGRAYCYSCDRMQPVAVVVGRR